MEIGNNIECLKTFRIKIPLFNEQGNGQPGQKYFFPDNPIFQGKDIVGIDLNCQLEVVTLVPLVINEGDLRAANDNSLGALIGLEGAKFIYCTIYDQELTEKFYNVPLRSFFPIQSYTQSLAGITNRNPRRVKPYYGKINPRQSYLFIPVGVATFNQKAYVSLTFYYN
jgi:hypothetical protein